MANPILSILILIILTFVPWTEAQERKCRKLQKRKEWRTLTNDEKANWVGAVKCLTRIRHERLSFTANQTILEGKRSLYDDFAYTHAVLQDRIHENTYFLPWHRWFTHLFDTSVREICGYIGPTPYWDWTLDHENLFSAPVFEDSPEYGLGGTGDCTSSPEADCIVTTGAFAPSSNKKERQADFSLSWPVPHLLRRNLTLITGWFENERPQNTSIGPDFVNYVAEKTTGDFFRFQHAMELVHNHIHNFVGGDLAGDCPKALPEEECKGMAIAFTPNDPLFWLHHAQLDRLWNEWQYRDPSNFAAFSGMPTRPHNMSDNIYDLEAHIDYRMSFDVKGVLTTPRMVLDIKSWPLCYEYVPREE